MERLTRRLNNNKIVAIKGDSCNYSANSFDCQLSEGRKRLKTALEKLADYEDLEEQRLLVRLPVNKNDEIYIISSRWTVCSECGSRFNEYSCSGCEYECDSKKEYYVYPTYLSFIDVTTYVNQFGKTIFLTYEEAEKKSEEMKKND